VRRGPLHGWPIVGWATLVVASIVAAILAMDGSEAGVRMAIRATARTSVVLFAAAFAASALRRLRPSPATRWLLANRRQLGVSFAVSHFLHLALILALYQWSFARLRAETPMVTLLVGGLGYVFIAAMAATSFDRPAARLGPRWWWRLHTAGGWLVWFIFFQSFNLQAPRRPILIPFALLIDAVLVVRITAARARRARTAAPAPVEAAAGGGR
jgi:DMSO/TMAO reductase YedYZ heme-binding membrane subunit